MIKLQSDRVLMVDVDSTLVMYKWPEKYDDQAELLSNNGVQSLVLFHRKHIELIKKFKMLGYSVVVWSMSGSSWAEKVVNHLNLQEYVDAVMSKPLFYMDDLESEEFMGKRIYEELE